MLVFWSFTLSQQWLVVIFGYCVKHAYCEEAKKSFDIARQPIQGVGEPWGVTPDLLRDLLGVVSRIMAFVGTSFAGVDVGQDSRKAK